MRVPGIPDEEFIRDERVPMTKEEIRVLSLSKAKLFRGARFLDVGSGTGSVAIEAGFIVGDEGRVYAVERDSVAIELIRRNIDKFGLRNIVVIQGEAPEALVHVKEPLDSVFIGGTDRLEETVHAVDGLIRRGGRVVINAILLETAVRALRVLEELNYKVEVIEAIIARGVRTGKGYAMISRNPIFIVYGERA